MKRLLDWLRVTASPAKDDPPKEQREFTAYCVTCGRSYLGGMARYCMWCGNHLVWAERLEDGFLRLTDQEVELNALE